MLVFSDIGEMRKIRKSANDRIGLVACQFFQQPVEIGACLRVGFTPEPHGGLAYRLDNLENCFTFLLSNHLPKQPAE
jgi:hypothetical protein